MLGRKTLVVTLGALCLSAPVRADLVNANFESPLTAPWITNAGGNVSRYLDIGGDHFALFLEPASPGPSGSSLFQDFVIGPGLAALSFEYSLGTEGTFVDDGHALPDAFTVRLLDSVTLNPLLGTGSYFYHDTRGAADSISFDSSLVTLSSIAARPDWWTVTVDLSSIGAGTAGRLQFDLFGTGLLDGQTSFAGVDNLTASVIPAPPAVLLGVIGLFIAAGCRARRQTQRSARG